MSEVWPEYELLRSDFVADHTFDAGGNNQDLVTLEGYRANGATDSPVYVFATGVTVEQMSEYINELYADDERYPHKKVEIIPSNYALRPNHWGMKPAP